MSINFLFLAFPLDQWLRALPGGHRAHRAAPNRLASATLNAAVYPCQKLTFFRFKEFVALESMKAAESA